MATWVAKAAAAFCSMNSEPITHHALSCGTDSVQSQRPDLLSPMIITEAPVCFQSYEDTVQQYFSRKLTSFEMVVGVAKVYANFYILDTSVNCITSDTNLCTMKGTKLIS